MFCLNRLEFMRNLPGWARALLNCFMQCFRFVNEILSTLRVPWNIHKIFLTDQTDPKQRITVRQLLTHPWMMEGYETPVKWQTRSLVWLNHPIYLIDSDFCRPGIARQCWMSRWWGRWQTTLEFQDRLRCLKLALNLLSVERTLRHNLAMTVI